MDYRLNIPIPLVEKINKDKHLLNALAFAANIKVTFVQSVVKNATYSRLKEIFGMGQDKLQRVISIGVKNGFLYWDGKDLHARNLREVCSCTKGCFSGVLRFSRETQKGKVVGRSPMRQKAIEDEFRKFFFANEIRMYQDHTNTLVTISNPRSLHAYKRAVSKATRKSWLGQDAVKVSLSMEHIGELMCCGKAKARKIMYKMRDAGLIAINKNIVCTMIQLTDDEYHCKELVELERWYKEHGNFGQVFPANNGYWMWQGGHTFDYTGNCVRFVKSK